MLSSLPCRPDIRGSGGRRARRIESRGQDVARGASELKLDLARSWMVGDTISDVLAGFNAGCRGSILVREWPGSRRLAPFRRAALDRRRPRRER